MVVGFILSMIHSSKGNDSRWQQAWRNGLHHSRMLLRIGWGLLKSDPQRVWTMRVVELLSRFLWQLPQTIGGLLTAIAHVVFELKGGVTDVDYCRGATVIRTSRGLWGAVSQGCFIVGSYPIAACEDNWLFQHEYGHYLQSLKMGWAYYSRIGLPSILSMEQHDKQPVEQDANRRSAAFFNRDGEGIMEVKAAWYDYAAWLIPFVGTILVGLYHRAVDVGKLHS